MDEPAGPDVLLGPVRRRPPRERPPDFESLFRTEFPRVARTVHHIVGDRRQADEVTQDAFLELLRHWPKVSTYDRPELWVRRVAIRKAQRERHRTWRRTELERVTVEPTRPNPRRRHPRCSAAVRAARAQAARGRRALLLRGPADDRDRRDRRLLRVDRLEPAAPGAPPPGGRPGRGGDRRCRLTTSCARPSAEDETWTTRGRRALRRCAPTATGGGLVVRRGAVAALAAAAVVTAVVLVPGEAWATRRPPIRSSRRAPRPQMASPSSGRTVLEGRWRTSCSTRAHVRRRHGGGRRRGVRRRGACRRCRPRRSGSCGSSTAGTAQLRVVSGAAGSDGVRRDRVVVDGDDVDHDARGSPKARPLHRFALIAETSCG